MVLFLVINFLEAPEGIAPGLLPYYFLPSRVK